MIRKKKEVRMELSNHIRDRTNRKWNFQQNENEGGDKKVKMELSHKMIRRERQKSENGTFKPYHG